MSQGLPPQTSRSTTSRRILSGFKPCPRVRTRPFRKIKLDTSKGTHGIIFYTQCKGLTVCTHPSAYQWCEEHSLLQSHMLLVLLPILVIAVVLTSFNVLGFKGRGRCLWRTSR